MIQPFVFISAAYSAKKIIDWLEKKYKLSKGAIFLSIFILVWSLGLAYLIGPLPFGRQREVHPFLYPQKPAKEVLFWQKTLKDESLKISSTGHLAPFFTSRRYFYTFSKYYNYADYLVLRKNEIYNYPEKDELIPVYEKLIQDTGYKLIYKNNNLEVYKKASSE